MPDAHLTHMMKILYPLTGIFFSCVKTSVNRSNPRPLLVVHSGNTTTGRSEALLISSRDFVFSSSVGKKGGTNPVVRIMVNIETR